MDFNLKWFLEKGGAETALPSSPKHFKLKSITSPIDDNLFEFVR